MHFIYSLLPAVFICFLSGCFARAEMELECVPNLVYTIDKNELRVLKMGTIDKVEANAAVFKHKIETARIALIGFYDVKRRPKTEQASSTLMLLGPFLKYRNIGLIPSTDYIYVRIDGEKTWIPLKNLNRIAAYYPVEQNIKNNLKLKISSNKGGWSSGGWECPTND